MLTYPNIYNVIIHKQGFYLFITLLTSLIDLRLHFNGFTLINRVLHCKINHNNLKTESERRIDIR